jgi:hypothetical protein
MTVRIPFTKPSTTSEEQVVLLRELGMIIDNVQITYYYLQHIELLSFNCLLVTMKNIMFS